MVKYHISILVLMTFVNISYGTENHATHAKQLNGLNTVASKFGHSIPARIPLIAPSRTLTAPNRESTNRIRGGTVASPNLTNVLSPKLHEIFSHDRRFLSRQPTNAVPLRGTSIDESMDSNNYDTGNTRTPSDGGSFSHNDKDLHSNISPIAEKDLHSNIVPHSEATLHRNIAPHVEDDLYSNIAPHSENAFHSIITTDTEDGTLGSDHTGHDHSTHNHNHMHRVLFPGRDELSIKNQSIDIETEMKHRPYTPKGTEGKSQTIDHI